MILEIYDLECLSNLFTYTGYAPKEDKYYQFCICSWRNDLKELNDHLFRDKLLHVGYNNLSYDYPLLHHILNHYEEYLYLDGLTLAQKIYEKSQEIITMEFSAIADKNSLIRQIDLFRIWHYNNKARLTSLKDLEVAMRMPNVEEMPIHHTTWCKRGDEKLVLSYNKNDVYATWLFFKTTIGQTEYTLYKGKDKLKLRQDMQQRFNLPCINYPDVKIGEQLILKLYSDKTNQNSYELKKKGGTYRDHIDLKDCIPHWANFESKEFNAIKKKFQETTITSLKGSFEESVYFHGVKMDYGTGGLHSCIKSGVYEADNYWMILDEDVGLKRSY